MSPRWWLELVTDMANEKDVGPDLLRSVCLIKRVEDPAVLSQHRGIRQGDATRMSPSGPGVAVRRANGKMMHEGAVNIMTAGAGGGTLPMTRGDGLWKSGHGPSGQDPKDERQRKVG